MLRNSLLMCIASTAQAYPDNIAITDGDVSVTYAALWKRALAFASFLRRRGLQPGDRVALILENSWEYAVAFYGILRARGIAVPLNAAAKARDHGAWIRHAEARWVVGREGNAEWTTLLREMPSGIQTLSCSGAGSAFELACQTAADRLTDPIESSTPACIVYTSGTTGTPKGVLLSHGNLTSNTSAIIQYLRLTPADSIVTILPFYYAYGSSVLHSHLCVGGRLILERGLAFPHLIMQRIADERATGFSGVPSTFALLMARVNLSAYALDALRYVTQAGGPMAPALASRLAAALPDKQIFLMYGQTEATSRITYLPPERLSTKPGSVGIPVSGVEVQCRTESGEVCAPGENGHVWVRGPNVMLGYWRNPEITAASLVDGWLSTGDIGHLDEEGYLFLSGRRSDIIKVGAHRVHPKDVEEVISELPGVMEAVVTGSEDEILGEVIHAYVIPAEGEELSAQQVKRHCLARLASYKVPKEVHFVSSLPRTASGKVKRSALPKGGSH